MAGMLSGSILPTVTIDPWSPGSYIRTDSPCTWIYEDMPNTANRDVRFATIALFTCSQYARIGMSDVGSA